MRYTKARSFTFLGVSGSRGRQGSGRGVVGGGRGMVGGW